MNFTDRQKQQLEIFKKCLLEKNKALNLFSRKKPDSQLKFLFEQGKISAGFFSSILSSAPGPVLDIGSGNGFPGLFFAVLYPKSLFYLCEISRKKSEFLKYSASEIGVSNVKILCKRAETIEKKFPLIFSQAAMPTVKMLKLLPKLLAVNGQVFLWKSPSWEEEWPKNKDFVPEVFKTYKLNGQNKVLLRLKRADKKLNVKA